VRYAASDREVSDCHAAAVTAGLSVVDTQPSAADTRRQTAVLSTLLPITPRSTPNNNSRTDGVLINKQINLFRLIYFHRV